MTRRINEIPHAFATHGKTNDKKPYVEGRIGFCGQAVVGRKMENNNDYSIFRPQIVL